MLANLETKACHVCGGALAASVCGDCMISAHGEREARRKVSACYKRERSALRHKRARELRLAAFQGKR